MEIPTSVPKGKESDTQGTPIEEQNENNHFRAATMNMPSIDVEKIEPIIYSRDDHCISRKNIDPDALKIMRRLIRHGYKAHLVGGGVRDLLLDKQPKDFDIATDATPRQIKGLFRNCRIIGRRFKLAHIYFKGNKIIEVSTFRDLNDPVDIDDAKESDNMLINRDNQYGDEKTDALRRDLTVNGLFYDLANFSIIDYVGGMEDLKSATIRVIGNPPERFAEDPVRMIRVVRHAARADFSIEQESLDALHDAGELLEKCSPMRIFEELKKDMLSGHSAEIVSLLAEHKLLQFLLPELVDDELLLFDETHMFYQSLQRSDTLADNSNLEYVTSVLAMMTLFATALRRDIPLERDAILDLCQDDEHLAEMMNESFPSLAVPRKEKERIYMALKLWYEAEEAAEEDKKLRIHNRKSVQATELLFKILPEEFVSKEAASLLRQTKKSSGGKGGSPKRRRRRRGGRGSGNNKPPSNKKNTRNPGKRGPGKKGIKL